MTIIISKFQIQLTPTPITPTLVLTKKEPTFALKMRLKCCCARFACIHHRRVRSRIAERNEKKMALMKNYIIHAKISVVRISVRSDMSVRKKTYFNTHRRMGTKKNSVVARLCIQTTFEIILKKRASVNKHAAPRKTLTMRMKESALAWEYS